MENAQEAPVAETTAPVEVASIEDRFAAAMGLTEEAPAQDTPDAVEPEAAAEPEPAPEEVEPDGVEIEINGEVYVVPQTLKEAFLRQQDYTRKTQEVAEQRKAVEAAREEFVRQQQVAQFQAQVQQASLQYVAKLQNIDSTLKQFEGVDWNAAYDADPHQAQKLRIHYDDLQRERQKVLSEYSQTSQQAQKVMEQHRQQALAQAAEEVMKRIPDVTPEMQQGWRETGKAIGFSDAELANVTDPRSVLLLHKAMMYDRLMQSQPAINKKVASAPKAIKPGAPPPKQSDKDVLKKVIRTSKDRHSKHQAISKLIERMV